MEASLEISEGLKLRKAKQDDCEFAYQVKKDAFRVYAELIWGWDEVEQRRFHNRRFREQDYRIINLNGIDIGIISMTAGQECLHVNQIHVLPEHQGQGVGRKCMEFIMKRGARLGLKIRLQVLKVNPRALAFYKRLGFTVEDESDAHLQMEGPER